jgi:hypothetical protein
MVFQPSRFYFALIGFNEPASARRKWCSSNSGFIFALIRFIGLA